ncbi:MAG: HlyD family efflux transporter periplasmic adaptor subunit [Eubacteriaceae bacterium]|jgi:HlyD family secretion protein
MEKQMETKKKNRKKIIIISVIAVVLCLAGIVGYAMASVQTAPAVETIDLAAKTLKKTVSTSGTTESTVVENISDNSGVPVWEIKTPAGTNVDKGDVLATLYNKDTDEWTNVRATIGGTVTGVNTQNGTPASGVLFTIQDQGSLRVRAKIKQNQLSDVAVGMTAAIQADGTNGAAYTGTVTWISPTASTASSTSSDGTTTKQDSSSIPDYEILLSITSPTDGLKIGMKTKLTIDAVTKDGVYAVPIDTVTTGSDGQKCVFAATDEKDGIYTVKQIPVSVGMSTDSEVEIASPDLTDGMKIVKDPTAVQDGDNVMLQVQS